MHARWKVVVATLLAVAVVGSLIWLDRDLTIVGQIKPVTAANILGVEWQGGANPNPGGSTGGGLDLPWQGGSNPNPAEPTGGGLDVPWQGGANPNPTGPTGGGLDVPWQGGASPNPADPSGGGLDVPWEGDPNANPTEPEDRELDTSWQGNGLDMEWAGKSPLSQQAIRLSYQLGFGREPSAAELTRELDRQSYDQSVRSLPDLLEAHRKYMRTNSTERQATEQRALAAVPGAVNVISYSYLLYAEMVQKLTIHLSYQTAFGRPPTAVEEQGWEGDHELPDLLERHRERLTVDEALRSSVIERAYQSVWQRSPIASELDTWNGQPGSLYSKIVEAIHLAYDPIMPEAPVIRSHVSQLRTSHGPGASTKLYFQQIGDRATSFRILRERNQNGDWQLLGSVPAGAPDEELAYADEYQMDRVAYKVCAVNQHGEACSEPYATSDKPNQVQIAGLQADYPTRMVIQWFVVGHDVTEVTVKRQRSDDGWDEVFRERSHGGGTYQRYMEEVKPATKRIFVVCAHNSYGETCTPWLFLESPLPTPVAPADFKVTAQNQTDWLISWRPQTKDPVRLQRFNPASRQWDLIGIMGTDQTQYLRQELIGDPWYEYRVCSHTGYNEACTPSIVVGKQFDHPTNFTSLDYAVYWFRCGTCRGSTKPSDNGTQSDGVRAVPGLSTEYFDPSKPTVIYVHGWARNSVREFSRESMKSPIDQQDMMAEWKKAGYNVGIFYWNAMSDDDWGLEPRNAEGKIDRGDITWSFADGRGNSYFAPTRVKESASVLFAWSILDAMQEYTGPEFRIVGHSLGTQMAVMGTYYLSRSEAPHLTPQRVALLDPWISSGLRADGLGDLIDRVKQSHGTVYEYYQTSVISQEHGRYGARAVTSRVHPMYIDWLNLGGAHAAALHWYFGSMALGGSAPTARMPLDELRPLMNCGCRFEQENGQDTTSVLDDTFKRHKK